MVKTGKEPANYHWRLQYFFYIAFIHSGQKTQRRACRSGNWRGLTLRKIQLLRERRMKALDLPISQCYTPTNMWQGSSSFLSSNLLWTAEFQCDCPLSADKLPGKMKNEIFVLILLCTFLPPDKVLPVTVPSTLVWIYYNWSHILGCFYFYLSQKP